MGDSDAQSGSGGCLGISRDSEKNLDAGLISKRLKNGSDEEGGEEAEGHGSQRVDEIRVQGDIDIFSFQKFFCFFHNTCPPGAGPGQKMQRFCPPPAEI